jgi:hypothetical protein
VSPPSRRHGWGTGSRSSFVVELVVVVVMVVMRLVGCCLVGACVWVCGGSVFAVVGVAAGASLRGILCVAWAPPSVVPSAGRHV